ncbi:SRPBCC domain-containing protein [Cryobacterium sp. SO1]|uniref:SRPBCC domain-containing protein n=1 Tax=Cryobacterium sp. SO1 TaxID=1897061 RepID=UPI001022EBBC|nr:SRPBCC domain-containing protein [Cryobacterium sp. SO1]RZI37243.1 hypothetical protein BJQ95_00350 [Cryobacterium sp. SO1]
MQSQRYEIAVHAPVEVVWETMLDDTTYRLWASTFQPGSYFEGSWLPGSEILFLGDNEDGTASGMVGVIAEHRPHEFVSIEYRGQIVNGIEDTTSDDARAVAGTHEKYTFTEADGVTTVVVDIDVDNRYADMFAEMWPRALIALRELSETEAHTHGQHSAARMD